MKTIKPYEELTLLERYKKRKSNKALLLDVSSSMSIHIEPGQKRIDALRNIVKNIHHRMFAFNTEVKDCFAGSVPDPSGGTWLSPALERLKELGIAEAVVLTDGEVNVEDQAKTLESVKGIKLQVLYIGSGPEPEFLSKLARETGGSCTVEDLTQQAELEERVIKLLGPVSEEKERIFEL